MKLIPLTQGRYAKVDDSDFEWLSQWKWRARKDKRHKEANWDAIRTISINGKDRDVKMSRVIMHGVLVDHKHGNNLDNQRGNLRFADNTQNQHNQRRLRSDNTTGYKGVTGYRNGRFNAQIYVNKKRISLGYFATAEQAAKAYDEAAASYFGDFAAPNTGMVR
jgi:hypothetical protein